MNRLEILVEEQSMAALLGVILPKILPEGWTLGDNVFVRPHQGKSDLKNSIPNKFKAFSKGNQSTGFIILHDQDANDCKTLKADLVNLCNQNNTGGTCPYKVRIVCHELEAWYFGDPYAINKVFPHKFKVDDFINKNICKLPDNVITPKQRLKQIVGDFPQIDTAKRIGQHMDVHRNLSVSFKQFVSAIDSLTRA